MIQLENSSFALYNIHSLIPTVERGVQRCDMWSILSVYCSRSVAFTV